MIRLALALSLICSLSGCSLLYSFKHQSQLKTIEQFPFDQTFVRWSSNGGGLFSRQKKREGTFEVERRKSTWSFENDDITISLRDRSGKSFKLSSRENQFVTYLKPTSSYYGRDKKKKEVKGLFLVNEGRYTAALLFSYRLRDSYTRIETMYLPKSQTKLSSSQARWYKRKLKSFLDKHLRENLKKDKELAGKRAELQRDEMKAKQAALDAQHPYRLYKKQKNGWIKASTKPSPKSTSDSSRSRSEQERSIRKLARELKASGMSTREAKREAYRRVKSRAKKSGDEMLYGYVDAKDQVMIPVVYQSIEDIDGEIIIAQKSGLYGMIDLSNRELSPFVYESISSFTEGHAIVKKGDQYGLINRRGKLVIPAKYDQMTEVNQGYVTVRSKDAIFLVSTKNKRRNLNMKVAPHPKYAIRGVHEKRSSLLHWDTETGASYLSELTDIDLHLNGEFRLKVVHKVEDEGKDKYGTYYKYKSHHAATDDPKAIHDGSFIGRWCVPEPLLKQRLRPKARHLMDLGHLKEQESQANLFVIAFSPKSREHIVHFALTNQSFSLDRVISQRAFFKPKVGSVHFSVDRNVIIAWNTVTGDLLHITLDDTSMSAGADIGSHLKVTQPRLPKMKRSKHGHYRYALADDYLVRWDVRVGTSKLYQLSDDRQSAQLVSGVELPQLTVPLNGPRRFTFDLVKQGSDTLDVSISEIKSSSLWSIEIGVDGDQFETSVSRPSSYGFDHNLVHHTWYTKTYVYDSGLGIKRFKNMMSTLLWNGDSGESDWDVRFRHSIELPIKYLRDRKGYLKVHEKKCFGSRMESDLTEYVYQQNREYEDYQRSKRSSPRRASSRPSRRRSSPSGTSSSQYRLNPKLIGYRDWNKADCKALINPNVNHTLCGTGDCRAIMQNNRSMCDTRDCKAVIAKSKSMCKTKRCKAVVAQNKSLCDSGDKDCKAFVSGNYSKCSSRNCKAFIKRNHSLCN